jgi:hypothetical protein
MNSMTNNSGYSNMRNRKNRNNNAMMVGGAHVPAVGSKAQVWHGTARHTSGGLHKKDLMKTKSGRIVSRRKHSLGKKAIKTLKRMGYIAKKGTFKLFRKGVRTMKRRGGADGGLEIPGIKITTTTDSASSASESK